MIERYTLPNHESVEPLDLAALRVLKKAKSIGNSEIEPMIDVKYILEALEEMTGKINEVIDLTNAIHDSNNYNEKIQVVAQKLNQVVEVINRGHKELAQELDQELEEFDRDLPKA